MAFAALASARGPPSPSGEARHNHHNHHGRPDIISREPSPKGSAKIGAYSEVGNANSSAPILLMNNMGVTIPKYPLELSSGSPPDIFTAIVGGDKFSVLSRDLKRVPGSRLCLLTQDNNASLCHGIVQRKCGLCYFFDRSSTVFDAIINVYRTGAVHVPETICPDEFLNEMAFWMIDPKWIAPCCARKLSNKRLLDSAANEVAKEQNNNIDSTEQNQWMTQEDADGVLTVGHGGKCLDVATWRTRTWTVLEIPNSSVTAMVYMALSCILVILTMIVLIMSSMVEFQHWDPAMNESVVDDGLEIADAACVSWFSLDYLLRLWACPDRCDYVKSTLSIIDILAILPFYVELLFNYLGIRTGAFGDVRRSLVILRILRVLRVLRALRVLKVARYSSGFQSMGKALKRSWRELALLIMFTMTANLMFSTAMYYFEYDEPGTHFKNIPMACWWCIITMTTVGYGDVYPKTVIGKFLGGLVAITGIILLAFPISIIVENFNDEYEQTKTNDKASSVVSRPDNRRRSTITLMVPGTESSTSADANPCAETTLLVARKVSTANQGDLSTTLLNDYIAKSFKIIDGKPHIEIEGVGTANHGTSSRRASLSQAVRQNHRVKGMF